jgi:DNA-binding beta-propeller fold protein YncE
MPYVQGSDLATILRADGRLPVDRVLVLAKEIASGLAAAHDAGIVHRDLKPANIMVDADGHALIMDFGIARSTKPTDFGMTATGVVVGTVEYMAPEQWRGERVGPAADVYALGCVLYEALTGIVPYARKEAETEPEIPRGIDKVIEKAVSKDSAERYASAGALIAAARERAGATPAATLVLSNRDEQPTVRIDGEPPRRQGRLSTRAKQWIGAGVAATAGLVAVLVLVLGGDGVSVSSPIPVAKPPLRLAVGPRTVWATSAVDGTLTGIDPDTRRMVSKLWVGKGASGVTIGAGSVWVSNPRTGKILRIDAAGHVTAHLQLGGSPGAIVSGGGRIWVADEDGAGITVIDGQRARVIRRGLAPHAAPLRLAVGAGGLWISSASTGTVRRIDLGTMAVGPPILAGRGPAGITVGHGLVWVANSRSATVTRVDPSTHSILGDPISVGEQPGGIDAGTEAVWVASAADNSVTRLNLESGDPIGSPIAVGPKPGAVVVGPEAVWIANNGDGTVTRIEP